ncbi:MAG: XRE family transcriptional regulator [Spirochaetia bacterium]|jgi:predicted DNA-binding protein YlxM (UPF0122 family)|nr:XRE family transcriptional regulator [Spirochaetia bacterium]
MRIDKQLKILSVKTDLSLTEIGKRLDKSPQAFSQKIKRGTFTIDELEDIAMVTGCKLECFFTLPNGDKIIIRGTDL